MRGQPLMSMQENGVGPILPHMIRVSTGLKIAWIGLSLIVLMVSLYVDGLPNHDEDQHRGVLLVWGMLILSFPSGLLIPYLFVGLGYLISMLPIGTKMPAYYEYFIFPLIFWSGFAI